MKSKYRDRIFWLFPAIAACVVIFFTTLLCLQLREFERSYVVEAKKNIAQEARLVAKIITPLIEENKLEAVIEFCNKFSSDSLRISLINAEGTVEADSVEKIGFLSNHLSRSEVQEALNGKESSSIRYSETLNKWMIYHGYPVRTKHGNYVLRTAIGMENVKQIIAKAEVNIFIAILLGAAMVCMLAAYIGYRIRKPLTELNNAARTIAGGQLETVISIPPSGMIHDLALSVAAMTEQLKKQLALTMSEKNEKQIILDSMNDGVLLFDSSGNVVKYNRSAAELFDLPEKGAKFQLGRCGIPELPPMVSQTLQTGKPFEKEFILVRGNINLTLYIRGSVVKDEGENYLLLTMSNLTNLRKLESFRSDFIANVSHEIKTPLTCIVGAVEALDDDVDLSEEQRRKLLDMLIKHSKRLNFLVQDILSLAALERRQLEPRGDFSQVELDAVLENAVHLMSRRAHDSNIKLIVLKNEHLIVEADRQLIEQALVNLIHNALKYSTSNVVEVALEKKDDKAVMTVRDYGIGIEPQHHSRIFERFYRVEQARSREQGGTGLGLAIVKHIAQLHNGEAWLESVPGKGSCFGIAIPLRSE